MNGLFARLYFDEDVSARLAESISARGFDLLTTTAARRLGASDLVQLQFASSHNRVLTTHNRRDFELLAHDYFVKGLQHSGLIIAVRRPPREMASRLLDLLNRHTADEFVNQVFYL